MRCSEVEPARAASTKADTSACSVVRLSSNGCPQDMDFFHTELWTSRNTSGTRYLIPLNLLLQAKVTGRLRAEKSTVGP